MARPSCDLTISTVSFPASSLTSTTTTPAPSLAKSSADSRPMPPPAPVINATLSFSLIHILWDTDTAPRATVARLTLHSAACLRARDCVDHSSYRFFAALADFSGDVGDQRALLFENPAGAEDAARNRRSDLITISDQVSAACAATLFGQKVEHDANGSQRILEEPFRRLVLQPVRQHVVGYAAGLDASGLRDFKDHLAFAIRDPSFSPCDLDERDYVQQRNRLRRVAQVLQSFENFLVVDAHHFGHLLAVGLARPALAQLLNQFLILPPEILFFQPMFALGEFISLSHNASTIQPFPSGS